MTYLEYELFVKDHFEKQLKNNFSEKITIGHQKDLKTPDGISFNIDLSYRFSITGVEYLTIIECKNWNSVVSREQVLSFNQRKTDLRAHKAIMVTTVGYQSGAIEYAQNQKIGLYKITTSGEVELVSHYIGNYDYYKSEIVKPTMIDKKYNPYGGYGIISPKQNIDEYFMSKFGIHPGELNTQPSKKLKQIPSDWYGDYEKIETCGLDLTLENELQIREINFLLMSFKADWPA